MPHRIGVARRVLEHGVRKDDDAVAEEVGLPLARVVVTHKVLRQARSGRVERGVAPWLPTRRFIPRHGSEKLWRKPEKEMIFYELYMATLF
jgi:hypothetical protein